MSSKADICNLALSHLGVSTEINDLDTERSQEAQTCRRFYDQTRQELLRDFPWQFATQRKTLARVATDPTDDWGYSYRFPSDVLTLHRVQTSLGRLTPRSLQIPFALGSDTSGRLVYTDDSAGVFFATMDVTDPAMFTPDFVQLFALKLAAWIAPRITNGDEFKLGERAMQMYAYQLMIARANAASEQDLGVPLDSEFITERG